MIKALQFKTLQKLRAWRMASRPRIECPECGDIEVATGRKKGEIVEQVCDFCGHRQVVEIQ